MFSKQRWVPELPFYMGVGLFVAAALIGCGGGAGSGGSSGGTTPGLWLSLSITPSPLTIAPSDSFFVTVDAIAHNTSATPTISLVTLPAGLTTSSTFPMTVPSGGATINFTSSSSIATGNIAVSISGTAGGATDTISLPITVVSGTPIQPPAFTGSLFSEVQLVQGSSTSIKEQIVSTMPNSPLYDVALSATGLPSGVTATFNPQTVEGNTSFTVTLTASSGAPPVQNAQWQIVGTPSLNVASASQDYLLDVTPASGGAGWNNQTGYVSTRATPYSAVYDPAHQLIYSAIQVWNQVDIISDKTRKIVKTLSIRDPKGVDLSIDGSTVWVSTGSQVMYGINTTTFQATRYMLPRYGVTSTSGGNSWHGGQVLSLADGTVFLVINGFREGGGGLPAVWNPATNTLTLVQPSNGPSIASPVYTRSGDGKRVFVLGPNGGGTAYIYDVSTKSLGAYMSGLGFGYPALAASNFDGSRVAVSSLDAPPVMLDGNLNTLGQLPGDGGVPGLVTIFPAAGNLYGGIVFSPDGTTLYEETESTPIPLIISIDVSTLQIKSLSPAMAVIPALVLELNPPFILPEPFAVDPAGMVLGIQYHGIAFDDATVNLNYSNLDPGTPLKMEGMSVYSGPLAGGTTSSGFGNAFSLTPDVYYGATKGTATISSSNLLSITSPPSAAPGPVDLKMLFPDGIEVFEPQFFTFGTKIEDAIISGGSPQGGAAAKLDAFGLPLDPSKDRVTIGGNNAPVTSTVTQYPPFTGEQTDMFLSFKAPSGAPGWADLTVTTPNGSSTLPKSFFFAKSVTDYSTSDSPTFVLYDKGRNQLYLSAGNHIDVFSLSTLTFSTPLSSPVSGSQFEGLALTPDGKNLLAADLASGGLAVFNPDSPSESFEISLPGSTSTFDNAAAGPLLVAAGNQGDAFITTGTQSIPLDNPVLTADLAAKTSGKLTNCGSASTLSASLLDASGDGSMIGLNASSPQIYLPGQNKCIPVPQTTYQNALAMSGDGNVLALNRAFINSSGNIVGRFAYPEVFYPSSSVDYAYLPYTPSADGALHDPKLNDAGSLYYWAYPNYIDIIDVHHGTPALRFGLTETVANVIGPMAIDGSGQRIFLITDKGLTIVDLGEAPLSVGHFSQTSAGLGTQIEIRGSGFENGIAATLGGVPASVTFTDSETLTLTVPSTNSGPQDLVLTNPDGKTYTLQNAINVQ